MAEKILHKLDDKGNKSTKSTQSTNNKSRLINVGIGLGVVVVAVMAGKFTSSLMVKSSTDLPNVSYTQTESSGGSKFGQKNAKLCPDQVAGVVRKGGVDGEGTHHLQRKGGESQNVYLTSSTIDLNEVVGKKVQVWGKTYSAQTAGWLMDACYLEIK